MIPQWNVGTKWVNLEKGIVIDAIQKVIMIINNLRLNLNTL